MHEQQWQYKIDSIYHRGSKRLLEFLDLRLPLDKESNNVCVQIFAKATNTFIYTLPCTCSPKHKIENILKGAVSRLRKIDDSDKKFEKLSAKYKTFLIVINYKPSKSKKKKKKKKFSCEKYFDGGS